MKKNGFLTILATNQRRVAKEIITEEKLKERHKKMLREIEQHGGNIDAIYYCPYKISDDCNCRKPKPGLILRTMNDFKNKGVKIDMEESWLIGNSQKDILTGKAIGLKTIKIGEYSKLADLTQKNLSEAARAIVKKIKD